MLAARERIQGGIGGDPVEPRAKRSALETLEAAPCAQISLLHEVLGVVQRTKHAVAVQFDFAAERFRKPLERFLRTLRGLSLT